MDERVRVVARRRWLVAAAIVAGSTGYVSAEGTVAATHSTVIVDLGTLGGTASRASDINSSGLVVGSSRRTGDAGTGAFRWTTRGGMRDLGTLGGADAEALAVNDRGQIVGWSTTPDGAQHAFLWTREKGMRDLGTLDGGVSSQAIAINARGVVLGLSFGPEGLVDGSFVWDAKRGMRRLDLPEGYVARDINDAGMVVGDPGFVWDRKHGLRHLDTGGGEDAVARGINDRGQIVGSAALPPMDKPFVAVRWRRSGSLQSLGTLPAVGEWTEGCCSRAEDVNDRGTVVGWALVDGDDVARAVVWDARRGLRDLGTLGGEDAYAYAINSRGAIVGESIVGDGSGHTHATMWIRRGHATP